MRKPWWQEWGELLVRELARRWQARRARRESAGPAQPTEAQVRPAEGSGSPPPGGPAKTKGGPPDSQAR